MPSPLTASYDSAIAGTLAALAAPAGRKAALFPIRCASAIRWSRPSLRREPAPVRGALQRRQRTGIAGAQQLQGKELSYNNLVDLDACWDLAQEFTEPAVAIIKHTNPCGAATGKTLLEAYTKALSTDPVSAFGGVIGVNREIDEAAAEEIAKLFVEAIAAPAFSQGSAGPLCRQEEPAAGGGQTSDARPGFSNRFPAACCCRMRIPAR